MLRISLIFPINVQAEIYLVHYHGKDYNMQFSNLYDETAWWVCITWNSFHIEKAAKSATFIGVASIKIIYVPHLYPNTSSTESKTFLSWYYQLGLWVFLSEVIWFHNDAVGILVIHVIPVTVCLEILLDYFICHYSLKQKTCPNILFIQNRID